MKNPTTQVDEQEQGPALPPHTSEQAEQCALRLCGRDDAHAAGCTTYDPARLIDRDDCHAPARTAGAVAWLCVNKVSGRAVYTGDREQSAKLRDHESGEWMVTQLLAGDVEAPATDARQLKSVQEHADHTPGRRPADIRDVLLQAVYALKEAPGLYSLGFNVRNAPEDGSRDETGVDKAEYEAAAENARSIIAKTLDMVRSAINDLPADPLDTRLPCDIKVGSVSIREGCKLRTLVTRMESLHRMAMSAMPPLTDEQKNANFQALLRAAAPANPAAPATEQTTKGNDNAAN